jgi:signal peptidase I
MAVQGSSEYKKGDVIIFKVAVQKTPLIHRIIKIENGIFSTKGDANFGQLSAEKSINKEQIVGKAVARIPALGWAKLSVVEFFRAFSK